MRNYCFSLQVFSKRVTFENGQITYEYDDEHDCMYSGQFGNIYKGKIFKINEFARLLIDHPNDCN